MVQGKNFKKYQPKEHELIFLSAYQKTPSLKILFKHSIKTAYENARSEKAFKSKVLKSSDVCPFFKVNLLQKLFGGMSLTPEGTKTRGEILKYLQPIDRNIPQLLKSDKKKALELLIALGGNIFLLNNVDFELLKKIDKQLLKQQKSVYAESYDLGDNYWYYFDFYEDEYAFDSYFDEFDSTIDSFDSDFDAVSCSSCTSYNSGCSSCSGCGGCGGCS